MGKFSITHKLVEEIPEEAKYFILTLSQKVRKGSPIEEGS